VKAIRSQIAILLLALLGLPVFGEDKPAADNKKSYANTAEECAAAIEARKRDLAEEYSTAVWSLKQRFQKDGDLEKSLAVDKEWSRSLGRKPLVQANVVDSPPELAKVQKDFLGRFDKVTEAVANEFLDGLRVEASELAKAGKFDAGRVLQREIDEIKTLYLGGDNGEAAAPERDAGDPVAVCEEMIRQKRTAIQSIYVSELESLEKAFQSQGDLESLFAVKEERKRFMASPLIAEKNVVEALTQLEELQRRHLDLEEGLAAVVAEDFVSRLEEQKKALTIEGKLDEAMAAKSNADAVRARYLRARPAALPVTLCKHVWVHTDHIGGKHHYVFGSSGILVAG
jgi:hypothetical protein